MLRLLGALQSRKGVTASEYALIAVGIVSLVAVSAVALGGRVEGLLRTVLSAI